MLGTALTASHMNTARNKRSVAQQSAASDTRVHLTHMTAPQPRGSNSGERLLRVQKVVLLPLIPALCPLQHKVSRFPRGHFKKLEFSVFTSTFSLSTVWTVYEMACFLCFPLLCTETGTQGAFFAGFGVVAVH